MPTQRIESWKMTIALREWEGEANDAEDEKLVLHFATEALAKKAMDQAYATHLRNLRSRRDTTNIEEVGDDVAWKAHGVYGKKVTWWKPYSSGGYVPMKDYFTVEYEILEREILTEVPETLV